MDNALETTTQRIRHHLRGPLAGPRNLLTKNARNTINKTDPHDTEKQNPQQPLFLLYLFKKGRRKRGWHRRQLAWFWPVTSSGTALIHFYGGPVVWNNVRADGLTSCVANDVHFYVELGPHNRFKGCGTIQGSFTSRRVVANVVKSGVRKA